MASDAGANAPPTPPAGEPSEESAQRTGRKGGRRFRWLLGLPIAAAAIAGLGYFVVSFVPDYIARYLVRTYFEGLAIDTSGVETIDIDPLRGEIRFGPVSFGGGEGKAGQVGHIKVRVDVRSLLSRQALIQSAEIDGIRIDVRQAADGAISINGIPLSRC